jgi:hypothetical protein
VEPVLELSVSASLANVGDDLQRLDFAGPGSPVGDCISELAFPGRHGWPVLSIRHMIVAVRRITVTRAIFEPRRRLIR